MDKSLDEVYQSPYEVNFSYDSIYNCLTNGKGDFELRGMGFNTGDIFVTAINYAPEEITECLQNIRNHIFDCSNSLNEAVKNWRKISQCGVKLIKNSEIEYISSIIGKINKYESQESIFKLFLKILTEQESMEIIPDIKKLIDNSFADTQQLTGREIIPFLDKYYFYLRQSEVIIDYGREGSRRYFFQSADDLLLFDLNEFILSNGVIKKCENCGKYFLPITRKDEKYCYYISTKDCTCKEIGYLNKLNNDDIQRTYRTIYKTQNARKQRNKTNVKNIDIAFDKWVKYAKSQLVLCKSGNITLEQMKKNISSDDWMKIK